jgi:hypothetical protein
MKLFLVLATVIPAILAAAIPGPAPEAEAEPNQLEGNTFSP